MIGPELIKRLKGASIEEIQEDPTLRLILGVANKKKGRKNIDFSCPSCIWEALTIFRKLSFTDFLTLITKKMPNRVFILKGEGAKARNFTFKRVSYSNANLTDSIALDWIKRNAKVIDNFDYSPAAFDMVKEVVTPESMGPVNQWQAVATSHKVKEGKGSGVVNEEVLGPILEVEESQDLPENPTVNSEQKEEEEVEEPEPESKREELKQISQNWKAKKNRRKD